MTLLIGYGNPGRGDDGLGPEFARWAVEQALPGLVVMSDFQLKVEHAIAVSSATRVIFVDSCIGHSQGCTLDPLKPSQDTAIDSHSLHPAAVLSLASMLFDATPPAFVLAIGGTDFEMLHDGLSQDAERNLAEAKRRFLDWFHGEAPGNAAHALEVADGATAPHGPGV
ncbi:MAG: hydrogenase maturation protease [Rhodobacteraceae bacterium]|nr:hydrogenase maturation protease [Alphaproteobacteria bacterium]NNF73493.1 hydrogenase maturation protease [Paracoccaceae bacterium]NNK68379.1 hydrogenase maturation protease [Paracoccaceae bacterium]